jgi:hypothetical protein
MPVDSQVIAIVIQTGGQILSDFIKTQQANSRLTMFKPGERAEIPLPAPPEPVDYGRLLGEASSQASTRVVAVVEDETPKKVARAALKIANQAPEADPNEIKAKDIPHGCIPCSLGHFSTSSGLLNEAMRFAKDGIDGDEVISRINMSIDEFNALERVDLRPEMTVHLEGKEKELATEILNQSRGIRHDLEGVSSMEDLEKLAARAQKVRNTIGRSWFRERIKGLDADKRNAIEAKLKEAEDEESHAENN